jgi:hypothetical protein
VAPAPADRPQTAEERKAALRARIQAKARERGIGLHSPEPPAAPTAAAAPALGAVADAGAMGPTDEGLAPMRARRESSADLISDSAIFASASVLDLGAEPVPVQQRAEMQQRLMEGACGCRNGLVMVL